MSWVYTALAILGGLWVVIIIITAFVIAAESRRSQEQYQIRRWQETVQAMRRMADEEGEA